MHLRLANFDGPLDLLLHLIKVQEINVFNIPIVRVTEQFLVFIRQVPELNFSEAGEYLAMAAQLVEIKSKMLLPNYESDGDEVQTLADVSDDDPRKPLVEQLLEHEAAAIRAAAQELEAAALLGDSMLPSGEPRRRAEEWESLPRPLKGDPFQLLLAFEKVLLSFAKGRSVPKVTVRSQRITIHTRMEQLKEKFGLRQSWLFSELLEDCTDRYELIVTLMAVLELCKARQLDFIQEYIYGPIQIVQGDRFMDPTPGTEADDRDEAPVSSGVEA
jgi:segregation and condensation protein A